MPNIVVIGASAGGLEVLRGIVRRLPADMPAALFVVRHTSPLTPSVLPGILDGAGSLTAIEAADNMPIAPGRIYVAPPDHHMLIEPGRLHLTRGPRENRQRPAIDATFRTAARAYGRRVLGIVLSGLLGDGTAGLQIIKSEGGVAIIQDPEEAAFDAMPLSALRNVAVDFILPAAEIGPKILSLIDEPWTPSDSGRQAELDGEAQSPEGEKMIEDERILGRPSTFTCPECQGSLWELQEGEVLRFRCRVGHAFSVDGMRVQYSDTIEAALWSAVRVLEESAALERRLAAEAAAKGREQSAQRFAEIASGREQEALTIRKMLLSDNAPPNWSNTEPQ